MGSGYSKKKKQAKKLQEQFSQMQEKMKDTEVTGQAGNGLVTVVLNGEYVIKSIRIKPDCVDPEDIEGLEDLIKAAHDDALQQLQSEESPMGIGGLGGMGLPDLGSLSY